MPIRPFVLPLVSSLEDGVYSFLIFVFFYLSLAESQGSSVEPVTEKLENTLLVGSVPADLTDGLADELLLSAVETLVVLAVGLDDLGELVALAGTDGNGSDDAAHWCLLCEVLCVFYRVVVKQLIKNKSLFINFLILGSFF